MLPRIDPPASWPFSRSCSLDDFPNCFNPTVWQGQLAEAAYVRWRKTAWPVGPVAVVNWTSTPLQALDEAAYATSIPTTELAALFLFRVLDRVEAPLLTLKAAADRLLLGGLLVATFAYWDAQGEDCASGHETRKRIYNRRALERLVHDDLRKVGLLTLGPIDWTYHGHTLGGDHTLHSLVVIKGERREKVRGNGADQ